MQRLLNCLFALALTPASVFAVDAFITDPDPALIFDDNDPGDALTEWVIKGYNEYFSIQDYSDAQKVVFKIDTAKDSFNIGYNSTATGTWSSALGVSATANGEFGVSMGAFAAATGGYSVALGRDASAVGGYSIAVGHEASANNTNSGTALGRGTKAHGFGSTAVGYAAEALGSYSVASGYFSKAESARAVAIGYRAYAPYADTVILGSIKNINGASDYASVGIGTGSPSTPLHVARNDGTAQVFVEDTDASASPKTLFRLKSNFNAKFEIDNTDGALWAFTNAGTDFRISRQGSGEVEFSVGNDGNAVLAGTLTQNSDVNAKQDIVAVDPDAVLAKVTTLPVSTWAYKDSPQARHLGPMAQDFHAAFGLGATDKGISSIDTGGVALAAIQALNEKLETRNRSLEGEVDALRAELADMKAVLNQLLPRAAQN